MRAFVGTCLRLGWRGAAVLWAATLAIVLPLANPARADAVETAIAAQVELISQGRLTSVGGVPLSSAAFLAELYRLRDYRPVWDTAGRRAELSEALSDATRHGFRSEAFATGTLEELSAAAVTRDPTAVATFDIAATEAATRLLHHLYYGQVDPAKLDADWALDGAFQPGQPATMVNQYLDFAS